MVDHWRAGRRGVSLDDVVATASRRWRVGVVSDTHGLVRPQLLEALEGSDLIVHAGDIGGPDVLEALSSVAPVHAVRGNMDHGSWTQGLSASLAVEVGSACLWVLHDPDHLDLDPAVAGFAAVITGHSHRPALGRKQGVLYLNPGSAGPRRFSLPPSCARLHVREADVRAELIELDA
jgi:putative phosphoesterase